jgi:hypothetical protein
MYVRANKTKEAKPNDVVMTPYALAKRLIDHIAPTGVVLDPARGSGAFYNNFPAHCRSDWCEIVDGRDFFAYHKHVDFVITNPPYSIYDEFLKHAFSVADNVCFLTVLNKTFKSRNIDNAILAYGGLKEVVMIGGGGCAGFPFGFPCGLLWYQRGYEADVTKITRMYEWRVDR